MLGLAALGGVLASARALGAREPYAARRRRAANAVRVVRDGAEARVDAARVAVGDVVLLEAGDRVPAGRRVLARRPLRGRQ